MNLHLPYTLSSFDEVGGSALALAIACSPSRYQEAVIASDGVEGPALAFAVARFLIPFKSTVILSEASRALARGAVEGPASALAVVCPPSHHQHTVILNEVTRSHIASDAVEGPASALAVVCPPSHHQEAVILSEVTRSLIASDAVEGPRRRSRHRNRPILFATALALALLFSATATYAQFSAGTTTQQPTPDTALLNQANAALEKSDYTAALPLLEKLSAANPKEAHLLFDLGLTQDNLDHTAEATAAYRAAAEADPKFPSPHLALGLLLARENQPTEAHTELLAAANLAGPANDPATAARALRALAQIDRGTNAADARDELLTAIKLSSETPEDILLSAQIAESLNDLPLAETAYKRILSASPNDPPTVAALAHVLRLENKLADAESLLNNALATHAGDTALTAQLASAYLAEDDPAKSAQAVPLAETLHQQHPEEASVTRLLARLYAQTKQPAKADPLYTELLKQTPNDPTLLDDYGANLVHLARFAEAETILKRAVADPKAFPTKEDLAAAYSDLAFSASENNDPTITLQALDLRAKVAPITAGSVFLEATAHDKLHQYKPAIALYKQFLDLPEVKANGTFADQEWEVQHRLIALEKMK